MNAEEGNDPGSNDVIVLAPEGMLLNRQTLMPFYRRLSVCKASGHKHVVVDLSHVRGFGAALLGWLVTARQSLKKTGGEVVLAGVSDRSAKMLKVSKLSNIFKRFPTVEQAVAALGHSGLYKAA